MLACQTLLKPSSLCLPPFADGVEPAAAAAAVAGSSHSSLVVATAAGMATSLPDADPVSGLDMQFTPVKSAAALAVDDTSGEAAGGGAPPPPVRPHPDGAHTFSLLHHGGKFSPPRVGSASVTAAASVAVRPVPGCSEDAAAAEDMPQVESWAADTGQLYARQSSKAYPYTTQLAAGASSTACGSGSFCSPPHPDGLRPTSAARSGMASHLKLRLHSSGTPPAHMLSRPPCNSSEIAVPAIDAEIMPQDLDEPVVNLRPQQKSPPWAGDVGAAGANELWHRAPDVQLHSAPMPAVGGAASALPAQQQQQQQLLRQSQQAYSQAARTVFRGLRLKGAIDVGSLQVRRKIPALLRKVARRASDHHRTGTRQKPWPLLHLADTHTHTHAHTHIHTHTRDRSHVAHAHAPAHRLRCWGPPAGCSTRAGQRIARRRWRRPR